jgi:hypothetical protein
VIGKKPPLYGSGGRVFERFLDTYSYDPLEAALELSVSLSDLFDWIDGIGRPNAVNRVSIQAWSGGFIMASSWGAIRLDRRPKTIIDLPPHLMPPKTRAECLRGPRPCGKLACRYHLWSEARPNSPKWAFPRQSCALDVAARGGLTLKQVGRILRLTRERVRQIEASALGKLRNRKRLLYAVGAI